MNSFAVKKSAISNCQLLKILVLMTMHKSCRILSTFAWNCEYGGSETKKNWANSKYAGVLSSYDFTFHSNTNTTC